MGQLWGMHGSSSAADLSAYVSALSAGAGAYAQFPLPFASQTLLASEVLRAALFACCGGFLIMVCLVQSLGIKRKQLESPSVSAPRGPSLGCRADIHLPPAYPRLNPESASSCL